MHTGANQTSWSEIFSNWFQSVNFVCLTFLEIAQRNKRDESPSETKKMILSLIDKGRIDRSSLKGSNSNRQSNLKGYGYCSIIL